MITLPRASTGSISPSILTSRFRIVRNRNVKLYVNLLMMVQRLGSLSKLIHRCTNAIKAKKNAQSETTAANLTHRILIRRFQAESYQIWEALPIATVYLPFAGDARSLSIVRYHWQIRLFRNTTYALPFCIGEGTACHEL